MPDSVERSRAWEAAQEFSRILWNPNVHCRVHNSRPRVPVLSQVQLTPTRHVYTSSILILSPNLLTPFKRSLPFGFSSQKCMCISVLPRTCSMPRPSHLPRRENPDRVWWRVWIAKLLMTQLSSPSLYLLPPQRCILQHPWPMFFPSCYNIKALTSYMVWDLQGKVVCCPASLRVDRGPTTVPHSEPVEPVPFLTGYLICLRFNLIFISICMIFNIAALLLATMLPTLFSIDDLHSSTIHKTHCCFSVARVVMRTRHYFTLYVRCLVC